MIRRITLLALAALCLFTLAPTLAAAADAPAAANPQVVVETSLGTIRIELFSKEAPLSVKNFLDYAADGFYNGPALETAARSSCSGTRSTHTVRDR